MHYIKQISNLFHIPTWLFVVLVGVVIFRIPTLFEPYSYGDETIYLTLGQGIRRGVILYKDLHDNKPPLLYLTAAIAGNIFWFKVVLLTTSLLTVTLFWKFTEKLYPNIKQFPMISTVVFAVLTTFSFMEGGVANAENFMILPTLLAFYILLNRGNTYKNIFISGVLLSISTLYKVPAIFDVPAIIFYWLLFVKFTKKDLSALAKKTGVLLLGIATPIALTFFYYTLKGAFYEYLVAGYLQNFGYLSSWRPDDKTEPFLVKNAPLLIRAGIVFIINACLFTLRKKVDKKFLFLVSWITFAGFAITLSERPYPHYLLQAASPISSVFALLFTSVSMVQVYSVLVLTIFFFIPMHYRFWHYRTSSYLGNFISFAVGKTNKSEYFDTFGGRTRANYEIAGIISRMTDKNDRIFVWEDSAQVYAISGRLPAIKYTSGYHITDFSTIEAEISNLQKNPPKVVVIFPSSNPPPELNAFVKGSYILYKETANYQIFKYAGEYSRFIIE